MSKPRTGVTKGSGIVLLLLGALGCDAGGFSTEGTRVALEKQTISWPLAGGLDTKRAPFALAPGSNLLVQDVREERLGEWRRRDGFGQDVNDAIAPATFGAPVVAGITGAGVPFVRGDSDASELGIYDSRASAVRWASPTAPSAGRAADHFGRPLVYSARSLFEVTTAILGYSSCRGNRSILTVYREGSLTAHYQVFSINTGALLWSDTSASANYIDVVAAGGFLYAIVKDAGTNLTLRRYSDATGAFIDSTVIKADAKIGGAVAVQAMYYGGNTITIAYLKTAANQIGLLEYNTLTAALDVDVTIAQNADAYLALMEEPDASGNRMLAIGSLVPDVRVLTVAPPGAVL